MKRIQFRSILLIGFLIALTCSAMAFSKIHETKKRGNVNNDSILSLSGQLSQTKIHQNGDGKLTMGMTMTAGEIPDSNTNHIAPVDLIIVLDRSGSMNGEKLQDAKEAIINIIQTMGTNDRLGLLSYSDRVIQHAALLNLTPVNRNVLISNVTGIHAGGGTNLGAGLQEAIRMLQKTDSSSKSKIMLISDGMANQGITDPAILAKIASQVVSKEASISTIGVGIEFNEYLMTTLADHGSGTYHFLENPAGFASIFQEELSRSKMQAVEGIEISIPLEKGIILTEAAGYPVENKNGFGIFRPGALQPGQSRTFYITLQIPVDRENNFKLENITAKYLHDGRQFTTTIPESFQFSCIQDRGKALASIDKNTWEEKVLQDDINKLREDVAKDIGSGKKDTALNRISKYKKEQESINTVVGSKVVAEAIDDLDTLQEEIQQTFKGAPSAVIIQQKRTSKSLQHKSYEGRRAIQ